MPGAFDRAWRWIADGADVVQGHCVIRNGDDSALAKLVAVEFEQIYAVSHPGRAALHGFGIFGGSNGYWRAVRAASGSGCAARSSPRTSRRRCASSSAGGTDRQRPGADQPRAGARDRRALWKQRMRWAQGWFQVSCRHLWPILRSPRLGLRQKVGATLPARLARGLPVGVADGLAAARLPGLARRRARLHLADVPAGRRCSSRVSGPLQTLAAWRLAAPEIRRHPWWFVGPRIANLLAYTEIKNLVNRVAHLKQLRGEHQWVVTPRTAASTGARADDQPTDRTDRRRSPHDDTQLARPTAPTPPRPRRPPDAYPLGWLRGLAALAVVIFHAYQHNRTGAESPGRGRAAPTRRCSAPTCSSTCSSCCRASCSGCRSPAPRWRRATGRPGWVLLLRRMARLLPLYYSVVLVVWALDQPVAARPLAGPAAAPDVHPRLQRRLHLLDRRPAWSLAVEFHFYVLMALSVPLVHAGVRRVDTRPRPAGRARSVLPVAADRRRRGLPRLETPASAGPRRRLVGVVLPAVAGRGLRDRQALAVVVPPVSGSAAGPRRPRGAGHRGPGRAGAHPARSRSSASGGTRCYAWRSSSALAGDRAARRPVAARRWSWRPLAWVGGLGYGDLPDPRAGDAVPRHVGAAARGATGRVLRGHRRAGRRSRRSALAWVSSRTVEAAGSSCSR